MKHTLILNEYQFETFYNWVNFYILESKDKRLNFHFFALIEIGEKLHKYTYIKRYPVKLKLSFCQLAAVQEIYIRFPQQDQSNIIGYIVSEFDKKTL